MGILHLGNAHREKTRSTNKIDLDNECLLKLFQMASLWRDGYIMGFVKRHEVESMLVEKPPGCFLLRFTDSEPGGITIAYTKKNDFYRKFQNLKNQRARWHIAVASGRGS